MVTLKLSYSCICTSVYLHELTRDVSTLVPGCCTSGFQLGTNKSILQGHGK